jgi:hypothetical protein
MVDGKTEIFRITLYQLLPGKWLDKLDDYGRHPDVR